MKEWENKVIVITGAASGIGKSLALQFAGQGASLALADMDEAGLTATESAVKEQGARVLSRKLDVAQREHVEQFAGETMERFGQADVVINNAGVSLSGTVYDLTYENFQWIMGINFWGTVYGVKAFLPHLLRRQQGHIVNLSSVYGLVGIPAQAAYCASKFAVRGFTEALRVELHRTPIRVSLVFPGGVRTNIARHSRSDSGLNDEETIRKFEAGLKTSAGDAAATIIDGITNNRPRILIGQDAGDIDKLSRFQPDDYDGIIWEHIDRM